jgi:hypothetical protein
MRDGREQAFHTAMEDVLAGLGVVKARVRVLEMAWDEAKKIRNPEPGLVAELQRVRVFLDAVIEYCQTW